MNLQNKIGSFVFIVLVLTSIFVSGCKKKTSTPPMETGTVTDIEGNTYKTVKIGNQWWMAENLRVKTYRNGLPIKYTAFNVPDSIWALATTGYYCEFQFNITFAGQYGLLYNWYAVNDTGKIAPAGWHVATDDDWKELEKTMGMSSSDVDKVNWRGNDEGNKLKIHSPYLWTTYGNIWSMNESGFTALPGACRIFNGLWAYPNNGSTGFWWTSTPYPGNNQAWYRNLDYKKSNVFRYYGYKSYGMSVRCVMD